MSGTARIIRGNALALPLADASVDLICASPPYFGLRSYQDDGAHYAGQIGSEATPAEFVDALIAATREMVRVLKPSGSIFVNLGDKYAGGGGGAHGGELKGRTVNESFYSHRDIAYNRRAERRGGVREKSLIGIPWRYVLRCIDTTAGVPVHIVREMVAAVYNGNLDPRACDEILREYENGGRNAGLGLILRAEIIWAKPNGLPESVTDRVRRSHEQWFHLVKQPRYYSAVDEIREEHMFPNQSRTSKSANAAMEGLHGIGVKKQNGFGGPESLNPLGKLPGSVWTIPTQPLTVPPELGVDHFAAFPMEWPRRIIQGWSPAGVCTACGEGRRPVIARPGGSWHDHDSDGQGHNQNGSDRKRRYNERIANGQVARREGYECACGTEEATPPGSAVPAELFRKSVVSANRLPPARPAVILDPFGGTGTTALVAKALGRTGISVDMSADYSRLATWRCTDPGQMAAALQVEKPEPVPPDQLDLFSEAL